MPASRPIVSLILALATTVLGAQTFVLQPTKTSTVTESHTVALANGSNLTITNTNGHIKVDTWDKAEVFFTGQFKPSSKDEQVKVVFESSPKDLEFHLADRSSIQLGKLSWSGLRDGTQGAPQRDGPH